MRRALTMLAALGALTAVAAPVSGLAAGSHHHKAAVKKVVVADDFYSPTNLTIKAGTKGRQVRFKWDTSNTDSHNVDLTKGPRSLTGKEKKKFHSATGAVGVRFNPVFKKKGTYKFICTIHPTAMKISVKVK